MGTLPEKNDGENAPDDRSAELKLCVHELWLFFKYYVLLYPIIAGLSLLLLFYVAFTAEYYY